MSSRHVTRIEHDCFISFVFSLRCFYPFELLSSVRTMQADYDDDTIGLCRPVFHTMLVLADYNDV